MPRPRAVSLFLQISWRVHVHSSVERRSWETGETRAAFSHARGHCRILCVLLDGLRKKRDCSCLLLMCFVFRTEPNAKREWHSSDLWRTARDNVKEKMRGEASLARFLLRAFLCAQFFIKRETSRLGTRQGRTVRSVFNALCIIVKFSHLGQIEFTPELPYNKQRLTYNMPPAHLTKFVATYGTAFWRKDGLSGELLRSSCEDSCNNNPIAMTFDATTSDGNPAILGFITSSTAAKWSSVPVISYAIIYLACVAGGIVSASRVWESSWELCREWAGDASRVFSARISRQSCENRELIYNEGDGYENVT